ncbi:glycosyltransferase family 2 protein [Roseateles sp. L2-2]|uniref:glycosyltransferase family 2 protein n=1 Tax=Roseateles sp. L2-2 TaxID=3422597 RepID=UPI003D36A654
MPDTTPVCLSIVSHGQGALIRPLLADLSRGAVAAAEIIVTLNLPEDESFLREFPALPLRVIRNDAPQGFGANHNAAFRASTAPYFVVVNPDIRLQEFSIAPLLAALDDPSIGLAAPLVFSGAGELQDSARRFPTVGRLLRRKLQGVRGPDYVFGQAPAEVDWVAGMFMVLRRDTYAAIGGFDDRYFMYFEDVDLCKRLRGRGLRTVVVPGVRVIHDAQRASRRSARHLAWHLTSAFRFLAGN